MQPKMECDYCKTVAAATEKYILSSFKLDEERACINAWEDQMTYNFNLSTYESVAIVNKIFLLRLIMELLCDDEQGNDMGIELFDYIKESFTNMKNLVRSCTNDTEDKYDIIDEVKTNRIQYEFLSRNSEGIRRIVFDLIVFHIDYLLQTFCAEESDY